MFLNHLCVKSFSYLWFKKILHVFKLCNYVLSHVLCDMNSQTYNLFVGRKNVMYFVYTSCLLVPWRHKCRPLTSIKGTYSLFGYSVEYAIILPWRLCKHTIRVLMTFSTSTAIITKFHPTWETTQDKPVNVVVVTTNNVWHLALRNDTLNCQLLLTFFFCIAAHLRHFFFLEKES